MAEQPGYLFIEAGDDILPKAALALGLKVISTSKTLNEQLITDENLRKTNRLYTLPGEAETLKALFADRSSSLSDALIEQAARNGHEKYAAQMIASMRQGGQTAPDLGERTAVWEKLDDTYKKANFDRAEYAPVIFAEAGYEFTEDMESEIKWDALPDDVKLKLAKAEHGRWNAERAVSGWVYAAKRDNEKRNHPCITAWDELSADVQSYDFEGVKNILDDFREAGLYLGRVKGNVNGQS
jgi:rubredoxin